MHKLELLEFLVGNWIFFDHFCFEIEFVPICLDVFFKVLHVCKIGIDAMGTHFDNFSWLNDRSYRYALVLRLLRLGLDWCILGLIWQRIFSSFKCKLSVGIFAVTLLLRVISHVQKLILGLISFFDQKSFKISSPVIF